jgi:hypothetical protein
MMTENTRCDYTEISKSGKHACRRVCTKVPNHVGEHALSSWSLYERPESTATSHRRTGGMITTRKP